MKKLLFALIFIPLFCTVASAEWRVDFNENYTNQGIYQAVKVALQEGVDLDSIIVQARGLAGLNLQDLMTALYCAGVKGQDIRDLAAKNEISESFVVAGYKESLAVCHEIVVDHQGYTPVTKNFPGSRRTRTGGGSKTFGGTSVYPVEQTDKESPREGIAPGSIAEQPLDLPGSMQTTDGGQEIFASTSGYGIEQTVKAAPREVIAPDSIAEQTFDLPVSMRTTGGVGVFASVSAYQIDKVVKEALREGVAPDSIVEQARDLPELNPQNLVRALYCAGVQGQDIRDAAVNNKISESVVTAGYKESLVVCRSAVADSHGYLSVKKDFPGGGRKRYGSPSTFQ